jgi:hypothetical protein
MDQAYPYTRQYAYQYTFVSDGKERIEKVVIFSSTTIPNLFNMGFGDISSHGSVDERILRNHFQRFSNEFIVSALILEKGLYREVLFNPASRLQYLSFYVKLKS